MESLPPELDDLLRRAMRAAFRKGHRKGRDEVLTGLKSLAKLNGSGAAVMSVAKSYQGTGHPLDVIGDAVLEALGIPPDRITKSFDESKVSRDHGRFSSAPGASGGMPSASSTASPITSSGCPVP